MDKIQKIQNAFRKYNADYNELYERPNGNIVIVIEYGDWKHSHLTSDWIMRELGYSLLEVRPFNEDEWEGEDWYSAEREYYINN